MTQSVDSVAPPDTREQCYRLLAGRAPMKVVIDTDLMPGAWYVVRGAESWERRAIANEGSQPPAQAQEL